MLDKLRFKVVKLQKIIIICLIIITLFLTTNLIVERLKRQLYGVASEVIYENQDMSYLFRAEVYEIVYKEAQKRRVWSKEAKIDSDSGQVTSEKEGQILDIESTVEEIMLADEGKEINSIIYEIKPYMTKEILEKVTNVIGSYRTSIGGSSNRVKNIRVAAKSINNTLVLPGETFSFNQVVGPRTEERGYKGAPVIMNGVIVTGIGGGVCQVSSTLYNAVQKADLEVVERYPHSKRVRYVPPGQDAAVAWNSLDFKFNNQYSLPVIIKGSVYGRQILIKILGAKEQE